MAKFYSNLINILLLLLFCNKFDCEKHHWIHFMIRIAFLLCTLLLNLATSTRLRLRPRKRLECQNLCQIHCKSNWLDLTACFTNSWPCLAGCSTACDTPDVAKCRQMCMKNYQLRCDISSCKAACRQGSSRHYMYLDPDDEEEELHVTAAAEEK